MILWTILRKAVSDMWEEMLLIIFYNLFWVIGTILIIPYPFVTFGLFYTVRDIGQGKGVNSATFFRHGKENWKTAYIWGLLNLGALLLLWINIRFYAGIEAGWAGYASLFFLSLTAFWLVLQLITLALYPRLTKPGFKLALRNAMVIIGRYPLVVIPVVLLIMLILTVTLFFRALAFILTFVIIALLVNSMVSILVDKEIARLEKSETQS